MRTNRRVELTGEAQSISGLLAVGFGEALVPSSIARFTTNDIRFQTLGASAPAPTSTWDHRDLVRRGVALRCFGYTSSCMTDSKPNGSEPERPRSEPEIIPPGQRDRRDPSRVFISIDENGGKRRVYMAQPGPLTIFLALMVLGLIGVVALIVLLSVALIWIPVVLALVAAFVASVMFRHWLYRLRIWWASR